jgi:DNA repair exonuclease SbcCD ATPase subunit
MTYLPSKSKVDKLRVDYATAVEAVKKERQALTTAKEGSESINEAHQIVQEVAKAVQANAHQKVSSIVSRCLEAVFDDPYEFQILFERKRGKTEANLVLVRNGIALQDPLDSVGGGVVDVASFALRVACVSLTRPAPRKLIVMDEPFKHVWAGYHPRLRALLESLAKELGFQFIIVTHINDLRVGKVIEL